MSEELWTNIDEAIRQEGDENEDQQLVASKPNGSREKRKKPIDEEKRRQLERPLFQASKQQKGDANCSNRRNKPVKAFEQSDLDRIAAGLGQYGLKFYHLVGFSLLLPPPNAAIAEATLLELGTRFLLDIVERFDFDPRNELGFSPYNIVDGIAERILFATQSRNEQLRISRIVLDLLRKLDLRWIPGGHDGVQFDRMYNEPLANLFGFYKGGKGSNSGWTLLSDKLRGLKYTQEGQDVVEGDIGQVCNFQASTIFYCRGLHSGVNGMADAAKIRSSSVKRSKILLKPKDYTLSEEDAAKRASYIREWNSKTGPQLAVCAASLNREHPWANITGNARTKSRTHENLMKWLDQMYPE